MNLRPDPKSHTIYTIAIIGFIYTMHMVIPMYSNSSFLSLFADERTLGFIYMLSAAVTIFSYLIAPYVIRRLGNYATTLCLVFIQITLFYALIAHTSPIALAIIFILQSAVISLIGLSLDIFLEVYTDGKRVGTIRGLYTTTLNTSWIIAPLIGSMLISEGGNYRNTYVAALAMLLPLLYLIHRNFPRFKDPNYTHLSFLQLTKHVYHNKNWVKLFFANIILQIFYGWMVIYSPLYLHKTIGFSWDEIGIILTIMLLPFILIQYPLGKLADQKYGEKEIMVMGFLIMGISTMAIPIFDMKNVLVWGILLFMTRVGAAAVEIMIETYFFKTVSPRDSAVLGLFRVTRPLATFMAPLISIIGLLFLKNEYLFVIVGIISLIGLYPAITIKDTR